MSKEVIFDKEVIFESVVAIGVVILIGAFLLSICSWSDDKKFYNGCQCGGHWEYQQAVGHQTTTGYIYKCNKCGDLKEFGKYYDTESEEN